MTSQEEVSPLWRPAIPSIAAAAVIIVIGLTVGQRQVYANEGNLIQNGSFESGRNPPDNPGYLSLSPTGPSATAINNWTVIRGGIDYYGAGWVSSDGSRSLDLNGTPGVGGVAQTFATTPNQKYRVSFDMAGHPSGLLQAMRVSAAGQSQDFTFQSGGDPNHLGWERRTWDFTANASQTTLEFYSLQTGYAFGGPALDNVHVAMAGDGPRIAAPSDLVPPVSKDDINRAWKCGLSAGLGRLKTFGPEGEDLYYAIKATLVGRKLAENRANLEKAAVKFAIDHITLGACFEPIFFPPAAGGGARPVAPTNLTVSPDPTDGTVMRLTWQDNSYDVSFQISNGNESRSAPAGTVEYTWTGLKPGSGNCFRVRANNGDTFSDWEPNASPKCAYTSRQGIAR